MHVISGLDTGGAEAMLVQIAGGLKERGFQQDVVSVSSAGMHAPALQGAGIDVHALNVTLALNAPAGIWRLARLMRECQPDVVQGWMYHGDLFAALAHKITPGRQRRLMWNLRASDTDKGGYGRLVRAGARLSHWPDVVLANSLSGLDFHLAHGYRPRRTELIANGIDTDKFRPDADTRAEIRRQLGISPDAIVAVHVARVNPMKDHATFLKAIAQLPSLRGLLVGAGTEQLSLPGNVGALGLQRDVARLYRCADFVVSSSAFAEGFSNVLAEGMSSGLIPIATDVGDARLIVGDTGQIVPIRNPDALAAAMMQEAARPDRAERKYAARQRIVQNFTLARAVEQFANLYTQATQAKP